MTARPKHLIASVSWPPGVQPRDYDAQPIECLCTWTGRVGEWKDHRTSHGERFDGGHGRSMGVRQSFNTGVPHASTFRRQQRQRTVSKALLEALEPEA